MLSWLFAIQLINIFDFLTKIYKITIDCFKPIISVGSTLTHVRYYLDDPVHLLVSCIEVVNHGIGTMFLAPLPGKERAMNFT